MLKSSHGRGDPIQDGAFAPVVVTILVVRPTNKRSIDTVPADTVPIKQRRFRVVEQRGFTLLEIMVVMLLIGISVAVIALNLERDIDQVAEQEARRFAALLEHLRDESIITGRSHGIEVDEPERRYTFFMFDKKWLPVVQDDSFRPRVIPEYLNMQFNPGQEQNNSTLVVVDSLGEIQPFVLTIIGKNFEYLVNLNANQNVAVERKPHEEG